jgi:hypothetical protein
MIGNERMRKGQEIKWRDPEKERQEAMHKEEVIGSLRQAYANRFSSKNEPRDRPLNPKKLRKVRATYKKCILLSNQINERKKQ